MRNNLWMTVPLLVVLPFIVFTASCSKKGVQTEPVVMVEPEVQKEPEKPAEENLFREPASRETAEMAFVKEKIHFDFDSAILSDEARQVLGSKVDFLRSNPDIKITVEGHCDDRGTGDYNIALGERRAKSVKNFLVARGIGKDRMRTVSYGEERPIAMGNHETAWAQNRRAQFVIN